MIIFLRKLIFNRLEKNKKLYKTPKKLRLTPLNKLVKERIVKLATEINKDITTVDKGIMIHQVNCQNLMGAGVARALYLKYPIIKELYHESFNRFSKETLFGKIHFVTINKNLYIGNSYTQFNSGNLASQGVCYTDHEKLKHNILKSLNFAKEKGLKLYLPKYIGCGLAGGNWSEISKFIYEIDQDNNIVICTIE